MHSRKRNYDITPLVPIMWQTGAVNWEQTTVMFKVSFQYGSCQTMSLSIIQYKFLTVFFM